jgi:hypothetical protein
MTSSQPSATRGRRRASVAALAFLTVSGGLAATTSRPVAAQTSSGDYFVDAFGDAMDFSNSEDTVVAADGPMMGLTNATISGGKLSFNVPGAGYFSPVWGGYDDSLPTGREASSKPIDAAKYGKIVIRMSASAEHDAGVRWYNCRSGVASYCQGGFNFRVKAGEHTYSFPMVNQADDPALTNARWAGKLSGLRVAFGSGNNAKVDVDWIKLAPSSAGDEAPTGGAAPSTSPIPAAGLEWNDSNRDGNRWDFKESGDVPVDKPGSKAVSDITEFTVGDGAAQGYTIGAAPSGAPGDPYFQVNLAGKTLDPRTFHKVAIKVKLDKGYSQVFSNGGGSALRLRYKIKGSPTPNTWVLSRQIAIYPNQEWIVFDWNQFDPSQPQLTGFAESLDPAYTRGAAHTTAATAEATSAPAPLVPLAADVASKWSTPITALGIDPAEPYNKFKFRIEGLYIYRSTSTGSQAPNDLALTGDRTVEWKCARGTVIVKDGRKRPVRCKK